MTQPMPYALVGFIVAPAVCNIMDPRNQTPTAMRVSVPTMTKKTYTSAFKAQVVLDILKDQKTMAQLASEYGVHPNLLREWKLLALKALPTTFEKRDIAGAT